MSDGSQSKDSESAGQDGWPAPPKAEPTSAGGAGWDAPAPASAGGRQRRVADTRTSAHTRLDG